MIRVTLNKLDNPPHTHGEVVLIAGTDTWDLTVMCVSGGYWVAMVDVRNEATRKIQFAATVEEARDVAREWAKVGY